MTNPIEPLMDRNDNNSEIEQENHLDVERFAERVRSRKHFAHHYVFIKQLHSTWKGNSFITFILHLHFTSISNSNHGRRLHHQPFYQGQV